MAEHDMNLHLNADIQDLLAKLDQADNAVAGFGNQVDKVTNKSAAGFNTLKAAVGGLVAALSVGAIVQMADAWTDMNSRVALAVGGTEKAGVVMARLNQIAKTTYSSLGQTAEGFLRNAATLKAMGYSTETQLKYTEALNNALVVSGAKGDRAASVQNALNKAMANGKLSGDELNTIIDSGGRVAEVLATKLGVTTLQLRQMGKDGKITSAVIMDALVGSFDTLQNEAASMPTTVGDAMSQLGRAVGSAVGMFSAATSANTALGSEMMKLVDFIDNNAESWAQWGASVAEAIGSAVGSIGEFLSANSEMVAIVATAATAYAAYATVAPIFTTISTALKGVTIAQLALNAAMMVNPIGLIVAAVAALVAGLGFLTQKFLESQGITLGFFDSLKVLAMAIGDVFGPILQKFLDFAGGIFTGLRDKFTEAIAWIVKTLGEWGISFDSVLDVAKTFVNRVIGSFLGMGGAIRDVIIGLAKTVIGGFNGILGAAGQFGENLKRAVTGGGFNLVEGLGEAFMKDMPDFGKMATELGENFMGSFNYDYIGAAAGAVEEGITAMSEAVLRHGTALEERNADAKAASEATEELTLDIEDNLVALDANTAGTKGNAGAKRDAANASEKLAEALRKEADQLMKQYNPGMGLNEKLTKYQDMVKQGLIDQRTYTLAVRDANMEAIDSLAQLGDAGAIAFKGLESAASGWLDTMIDGIIEGNMNWGDFAKQILKDLAKIALQAALQPLLKNIMGGLGGGLAGKVGKNAVGGRVGSGWKLYGENGPELAWQSGNGTVLTSGQTQRMMDGGGGSGGGNITMGDIYIQVPTGTPTNDADKIARAARKQFAAEMAVAINNKRKPQTIRG